MIDVVSCEISGSPITVGKKATLSCNVDETLITSIPQEKIGFIQQGKDPEHSIAFLGSVERVGGTLKQTITGYRPGDFEFTGIVLKIDDKEFKVSPVRLGVDSVIDRNQQQPTPYPNYEPMTQWAPLWWWIMWGGIFLFALAIGIWRFIKWKRAKRAKAEAAIANRPLSPREKFQNKMRKLESQNFHMLGQFKNFAIQLSQIMKSALADELKFPADDQTTEELFLTLQSRHKKVYARIEEELKPLLLELDQIKFAKKLPTPEECRIHLDHAHSVGRKLFGGSA